jgi:hypothetical protein
VFRDRPRLIADQLEHLREVKLGLGSQGMVVLVDLAQRSAQVVARTAPVDSPQLHAPEFVEQGRLRCPRRAAR